MDIGHLFETLDSDHRSITLSVVLCFPLAYLDCWKLSASFSSLPPFPQAMLALAVAIIFSFAGVSFNMVYLSVCNPEDRCGLYPRLMMIPAVSASAITALMTNPTPSMFMIIYALIAFLVITDYLFLYKRWDQKEEVEEDKEKEK